MVMRGPTRPQGGHFLQSLPVCVVKIWREMVPFSIQIGTGGYVNIVCFSCHFPLCVQYSVFR